MYGDIDRRRADGSYYAVSKSLNHLQEYIRAVTDSSIYSKELSKPTMASSLVPLKEVAKLLKPVVQLATTLRSAITVMALRLAW
jgi:hypothetical protein